MNLLIVTDIFQTPTASDCIATLLPNISNITRLHLNTLCNRPDLNGTALHRHLVEHGGMDVVIQTLKTRSTPDTIGLGYSAGGTALWRAVAMGLELSALVCISSTRLREDAPLPIPNHVYFGGDDPHIPPQNWMAKTPTRHTVFQGAAHDFYNSDKANFKTKIATDMAALIA